MDSDRFRKYVNGHHVKILENTRSIFQRNYGISGHFGQDAALVRNWKKYSIL